MNSPKVKHALISVSDKLGLNDFARGLTAAAVQIYSTGGTRKHLESEGIPVRDVAEYTGFPEMLDGRVKTLHPKVHAGILCRHDRPEDLAKLAEHGIVTFELVVVNLYPFEATIARSGVTDDEAIEQIDIGGPSLLRGAAKNHAFTTVVTEPAQYAEVLHQINETGATSLDLRRKLAAAAFAKTAAYDRAITGYLSKPTGDATPPEHVHLSLRRKQTLRYGENPHQAAAVYSSGSTSGANLISARQLAGKELSYNNLLDLDSALTLVSSLPDAAAVVIKHNNPCGAASASSLAEALRSALDGDPLSAFGSVLGLNRPVDAETAAVLCDPNLFIEAIVAPEFSVEAVQILTNRPKWKANVRLLQVGPLEGTSTVWQFRPIEGGFLAQQPDLLPDPEAEWTIVTKRKPTNEQLQELCFAWALVRHVKSNAIVVSASRSVCGVGAGQMSRVDSVEIALRKSGERARGAVMASDAFFPFPDSIELAAAAGIAAIIQPGGSRRDEDVFAACDRLGLSMVLTGRRHFKH